MGARVLSSGDIVSIVTRCQWSQTRYFGGALASPAVVAGMITDIAATEPSFVLERFEVSGDRLEVAGHWRGLRGRRFVRPVLWLHRGEDRRRLVAVLDHKPWAADDGEAWIAAFAWKGGKLDAERAELEVGREWVVDLPLPGARARKAPEEARPARPRPPSDLDRARQQLARATKERDRARDDAEQARADGERLVNDEYRQREHALAAAEEATARAREAETALDLAQRQLAAARASHAQLEERLATADSDQADRGAVAAERDRLQADLEAVVAERDRLQADLAAVASERDRLRADVAAAGEERNRLRADLAAAEPAPAVDAGAATERLEGELAAAWAERERIEGELAAARAGRERVEAELVAARVDRKRAERELAAARTEAERRPAARRSPGAIEPASISRLAPPRSGPALWVVRLVAFALVSILLVAVAQLVGGVL